MKKETTLKTVIISVTLLGISIALYFLSGYSYLFFHSFAEIFSVIIACGIFMIAWNSKNISKNNYLMFIGITYLFIAYFDLLHTLSYKGMSIFTEYGANLPTQLWIIPRYLEGISLAAAPFFLTRKVSFKFVMFFYFILSVGLTVLVFLGYFPVCYIESTVYTGLTSFKKISEYIISVILICAVIFHIRKYKFFDKKIFILMIASIILTIFSEILFTFYISVYGLSNFFGHLFKIFSFFLIYKCVIETCLQKPFSVIFHNLKINEEKLVNALKNIKTLHGLIPICVWCKKIRDDKGYWKQIEVYVREHSEADFSHGISPDCEKKLYPELTGRK